MPNAATALVIAGFATGLGLATLVALPGQTPSRPVAALPERPAPDPAPDPGPTAPTVTLAGLPAIAPKPAGAGLAVSPAGFPRD